MAVEVDWPRLVAERNDWVAYNFPREVDGQPGLGPMLGVIEELGELAHAHLKEDWQIRGDTSQHQADAKDAVGDLSVYLMGLMSLWDNLPDPLWQVNPKTSSDALLMLAEAVGDTSDYFRRYSGRDRDHTRVILISRIVACLKEYCLCREWNYTEIVVQTWAGVRRRDWIKYPDNGLPPTPRTPADEIWEEATWESGS